MRRLLRWMVEVKKMRKRRKEYTVKRFHNKSKRLRTRVIQRRKMERTKLMLLKWKIEKVLIYESGTWQNQEFQHDVFEKNDLAYVFNKAGTPNMLNELKMKLITEGLERFHNLDKIVTAKQHKKRSLTKTSFSRKLELSIFPDATLFTVQKTKVCTFLLNFACTILPTSQHDSRTVVWSCFDFSAINIHDLINKFACAKSRTIRL